MAQPTTWPTRSCGRCCAAGSAGGWAAGWPSFATAVAAPAGSIELVVQYVRDGDVVWIVPGQPERKQWWRNMLDASPIDIWLAGHHLVGVARVVNEANDRETVAAALVRYRLTFPRATHTSVVVRVDVSPTPGPGDATQGPGTTVVDTGAGSS